MSIEVMKDVVEHLTTKISDLGFFNPEVSISLRKEYNETVLVLAIAGYPSDTYDGRWSKWFYSRDLKNDLAESLDSDTISALNFLASEYINKLESPGELALRNLNMKIASAVEAATALGFDVDENPAKLQVLASLKAAIKALSENIITHQKVETPDF